MDSYSPVRLLVLAVRSLGVLAVIAWAGYIVGLFRTQQVGFSPGLFLVAAFFVMPLAMVPFLGLRWRSVWCGMLLTILAAVGSVEGFAAAEEASFRQATRTLPATAGVVFRDRAWPFGDHYLFYDAESGQLGAGD